MPTNALVDMFGPGLTEDQYATKLDTYKRALAKSYSESDDGQLTINKAARDVGERGIQRLKFGRSQATAQLQKLENLNKAVSGSDINAEIQQDIAALLADVRKDWTPTNPVASGLVPYDLEAPAKLLVPLFTPLRNSIPRTDGKGNARQYKRINSFTNAGVPNGAANMSPFFSSLSQTSAWGPTGNINLARPAKISYTGDSVSVPYVELGFSDSVDWIAQFEGLGFDDQRGLSHTALLYAHFMGEEKAMLYGRGTQTGYSGVVTPPTITVVGSDTGGQLPANTYFIYVAAVTGFGQTAVSAVQNSGARTGGLSSAVITVSETTGSLGVYNLYVGTVTGIANAHFQGQFVGNTFTLTTYNAGGAVIAGTDSSADPNAYDGLLTVQSNPAVSGYFTRLNAALSTTNPGGEIDLALSTMFTNNGADPDELWMTGPIRNELTQAMRKGGASGFGNGYRTQLMSGDGSVTMGTVVTGFLNGNTGKTLDIKTHRFMLSGNILIRSTSLPLPTPHIPAPVAAINVQDYMAVDWPDIQMTYDQSTYQIGTLAHYAPAWSGLISNVL